MHGSLIMEQAWTRVGVVPAGPHQHHICCHHTNFALMPFFASLCQRLLFVSSFSKLNQTVTWLTGLEFCVSGSQLNLENCYYGWEELVRFDWDRMTWRLVGINGLTDLTNSFQFCKLCLKAVCWSKFSGKADGRMQDILAVCSRTLNFKVLQILSGNPNGKLV